jgi:hypothetical protein
MVGKNELVYHTVREIEPGEEMTGFYGPHYFGELNQECRCRTCQSRRDDDTIGAIIAPRRRRQKLKPTSNTLPPALRKARRRRRIINAVSIKGTGTVLINSD